jgi:uncharacterized protein YndB with AHSA1/START domain/dihydrofolate reductase
MFNLVTLDGFFEGPNREIDWHNVTSGPGMEAEFNEYAVEMLNSVDVLLFGRVTYELMASYWPAPDAVKNDPLVAERMNNLPKIVFSRTLDKVEWHNTRLVKDNIEEEIKKMKKEPGKDMVILGSGSIVSELALHGLIDEYRIMLNPVVLGRGKPLFSSIKERLDLKLLKMRTFRNGNVLLYYQPAGKEKDMAIKTTNISAEKFEGSEIVIARVFDAPRELVWKAWTDPEHLRRWWGPKNFTSPVCKIDLRVGGKYLSSMRSPEGQEFWSTGVYREIVPPERLVMTDSFADKEGNVVPASHYGMSGDWPLELLVTVTFEDVGSKTRMTLRHEGIPAGKMSEDTKAGWNESFDKLADELAKARISRAA